VGVFTLPNPVAERLFELQDADDASVTHDSLERVAHRVIRMAASLSHPIVVPVGDSAQRVLGAVTLLSRGCVEASTWARHVDGREVLLVGTVAATPIEFETVATVLRRQGAAEVHACALHIDALGETPNIDSFELLDTGTGFLAVV
jgi:phosphoribosylpyrophosphate synthetase